MFSAFSRSPASRLLHRHRLWKNLRASARPYSSSQDENTKFPTAPPLKTTPSQQNHHDLKSFLEYAARVSLLTTSTTYVGTHYEYSVLESLRRFGFSLKRTGVRADLGIDLLGHWAVPSSEQPLKVIVQCKALGRPPGPNFVRELTGALGGAPVGWRGDDVVGILVAPREATKGVREAMGMSHLPMAFLKVGIQGGRIEQCLWNQAASRIGLEGVGVTLRYLPGVADAESKTNSQPVPVQKEIVLTWKGDIVPSLVEATEVETTDQTPADLTEQDSRSRPSP